LGVLSRGTTAFCLIGVVNTMDFEQVTAGGVFVLGLTTEE